MTTYETRHVGFAAFLRYCLGNESHISTKRIGNTNLFTFADPEYKCRDLQTVFFSDESAVVGNARELLDCSRDVSHTIIHAKQFDIWEQP